MIVNVVEFGSVGQLRVRIAQPIAFVFGTDLTTDMDHAVLHTSSLPRLQGCGSTSAAEQAILGVPQPGQRARMSC